MDHRNESECGERREDERAEKSMLSPRRKNDRKNGNRTEHKNRTHVKKTQLRMEIEAEIKTRKVKRQNDQKYAHQVTHQQSVETAFRNATKSMKYGAEKKSSDGAQRGHPHKCPI